jgi:hypothetical protein
VFSNCIKTSLTAPTNYTIDQRALQVDLNENRKPHDVKQGSNALTRLLGESEVHKNAWKDSQKLLSRVYHLGTSQGLAAWSTVQSAMKVFGLMNNWNEEVSVYELLKLVDK